MVNYACEEQQSHWKLWWRLVAVLTCNLFVTRRYRGENWSDSCRLLSSSFAGFAGSACHWVLLWLRLDALWRVSGAAARAGLCPVSLSPSLSLLQSVFAVLTSSPCPPPASGCRSLALCGVAARAGLSLTLLLFLFSRFFTASAPCSLPAIGCRSLASAALRLVLVSLSREAAQRACSRRCGSRRFLSSSLAFFVVWRRVISSGLWFAAPLRISGAAARAGPPFSCWSWSC